MAASATTTFTLAGLVPMFPNESRRIDVQVGTSATIASGTVLGEVSATPGVYGAYSSTASDGTEIPKGIMEFDVKSDSSGNITLGTSAGDSLQISYKAAPMFVAGTFNCASLTGLDANAVTKLGGRLLSGTTSAGIFRMP